MKRHRLIAGSERREFGKSSRLGPAKATARMSVTVVLSPDSTREHAQSVRRQAQRYGLTCRRATRHGIILIGRVADMQRAFQVSLDERGGEEGRFRCRTGPYSVPEGFGSNVVAILGLDTRPQAKPHYRSHALAPRTPEGARFPRQFAQAYGFPGHGGARHSVGIISLGGQYQVASMRQAFMASGLLRRPKVLLSGRQRAGFGATMENMLDSEIIATIVPNANTYIYFRPNTTAGFYNAVAAAVRNRHDAVSISWGAPEQNWTRAAMTAFNNLAMLAGQQGVTITAASGDDGSEDGTSSVETDCPASCPYILGVGGTKLTLVGNTYDSEVVWNSPKGATGGGYSEFFTMPDYQSGVNTPANTFRMVPDVAAVADPDTGYIIHLSDRAYAVGGTSGGAPLWAALICRMNAILGRRLGFIHPALYGIGPLRNIVSGNNGAYQARAGFDLCTGLGSIPENLLLLLT